MSYPINPHFSLPFRMAGSRVAVEEQDSDAEIVNAAVVVLRYETGQRPNMPEFGIPDQALRENGASLSEIRQAVARWEDRADAEVMSDDDLSDAIHEVRVEVSANDG